MKAEANMNKFTSQNSPLRIATVPVPGTRGQIGMTICPGKQGPSNGDHYWERDLGTDMDAILEWGADAVVTLLEDFEFDLLKVRELEKALKNTGIMWFHFEITDGAAPDQRFETAWPAARKELCDLLCDGRKILIHCRGGLGRTGTLAALLLREFGATAIDAIRIVRNARPGAIETWEQTLYVENYSPVWKRVWRGGL